MAYVDKVTTLQRFVCWDNIILFEGVLIDEHLLVGRDMASSFGTPVITIELDDGIDETLEEKLEHYFGGQAKWKLIDKAKAKYIGESE